MNKFLNKIVGIALGIFVATGIFTSTFLGSGSVSSVEAATGTYSRNQATYYTSDFTNKVTSSQYGTTLLSTLHELMYETHKSYNTYDELWTYIKESDYDIDNPDNITLLYSRQSINGIQNSNVWNREHVWCQSHAFYKTETGAGSDLHHLRPASTNYNSTRNNTPYGIVDTHDSTTRMGDTDCYYNSSRFEPADYIKGDVARILMYMYMHYSSSVSGTSTYSGTLNITDIVTTSSGTTQAAWDLLMDWNEFDPVDYQEMIRNNKCSYLLGNYNPFIDHPEFARMIWDDTSSQQAGLFFQTSYKTVNVGSTYTNLAGKYGNVSSSDIVIYTSDNPDIASVSNSGVVTGISNGVTRIKARCTINGVSKISYHFVVVGTGYVPKHTLNASGVVYTPTTKTTAVASEQLGSETVTYTNSYGVSQLTSGKSLTLTINNFPKTISSFILYMKSNGSKGSGTITVTVGGSSYYSKTGSFKDIYGSYSTSFVPLDITNSSASKKTGTIVINISCSENSLYLQKVVIDYSERTIVKASSISVSPSSVTLTPGEDNVLTTTFSPSNTTLQTCTWSSSNTSVATVNKYGLVRAIAVGNAVITATASDGSGKTGATSVTVTNSVSPGGDPIVTGVTVSPSSTSLDVYNNPTTTLVAVVNGTNNPSQAVTWSVSSASPSGCATVNSSGLVTAVNVGTAVIRATSVANPTYSGSCTVTITNSAPVISSISATVSKTYYVGDIITSSDISVEDNLGNPVTFTFANDNYQFQYSDASSGGSLTDKVFTDSISGAGKTCSLTVQVQRKARENVGAVSDTLDRTFTGVSGNNYKEWSGKSDQSSAVYAGNSAGGNESIQLRSNNSNSGIVSTSSGGTLTKVTVTWSSSTTSGRTLDVYGKNTAYSAATDLYSTNNQGTLLGTIVYGKSTEFTITGSYTFVGVRSNSGALYLTDITFTYGSEDTATNVANYIMYEDTNNQCVSKFPTAKGYFDDLSTSERQTFMSSNDYVISNARTRFQDWARHLGKTIVYQDGDYVVSNSINISPVINTFIRNNSVIIVIVVSALSVISIGGYFLFRKKKD